MTAGAGGGYHEGVNQPLSLYIHVPFCKRKCHYCDFNTYAGLEHLLAPYVDALVRDIERWGPLAQGHTIGTVFFGGGTPSLLKGAQMQRILDAARANFTFAAEPEISMEANPSSTEAGRLKEYRAAGVNRISFGAQSFHPDELDWLGRLHSSGDIGKAVRSARRAGFERVNLDLIYGLPEQSLERWEVSVRMALDLKPEHLSLYALTVEEGTPLHDWVASGRTTEPDGDLAADMYMLAGRVMAEAGFEQYEISNWAKPGEECRHNLVYWHNQEYLGLGPGAHSRFGDYRFSAVKLPQAYNAWQPGEAQGEGLEAAIRAASPIDEFNHIDGETDLMDTLVLGLRLSEGLTWAEIQARHGVDALRRFEPVWRELQNQWLLGYNPEGVFLTYRGRLLANEVFVRLMAAQQA